MTHTNRGFTFLELLLVIGIIAMMLAIVLPRFNKSQSSDTRQPTTSEVQVENTESN